MRAKYAYGIIPTGQEFSYGSLGIRGTEVATVPFRDVACVVSDYSGRDYFTSARSSLSREKREQIIRDLIAHQAVCERVMKDHIVLPMKFGTVVDSGEEVERLLQQGYNRFSEALAQIEGKVEFEVAATWDLKRVFQQISREKNIIPKKVTREEGLRAGIQVKEELDRRRDVCRREMVDYLKELALDTQENALLSDEMVMNVALLLHPAREEDLDRRVEKLNDRFNDEINFRVIGPLPPYSFSTMEVRRASAEEVEEARRWLGLGTEICEDDVRQAYRGLVAESHPDVNPADPDAEDKVNRLRRSATLLTEYCQGQGTDGKGASKVMVSLLPEMVANTFVISIKRGTLPAG